MKIKNQSQKYCFFLMYARKNIKNSIFTIFCWYISEVFLTESAGIYQGKIGMVTGKVGKKDIPIHFQNRLFRLILVSLLIIFRKNCVCAFFFVILRRFYFLLRAVSI